MALWGSKPPKLKEAQTLQAETGFLGQAIARLADALVGAPCKRLLAACFCAGTLLRTHGGLQAIETLKVGDRVLSRDEHDRSSANDYKVVEEVFERLGRVWHLTAGGRLIRTTGEHPFQEVTKGWIACFQLAAGDRLVCEDGSTVLVEAVVDTGAVEVVYNLRVADWHTYFVGGEDWGFSVWAHNAYTVIRDSTLTAGSQWITVADNTPLPSNPEDYVRTMDATAAMVFTTQAIADSVAFQMNNPRNIANNNLGTPYERYVADLPQFADAIRRGERLFYPRGGEMTDIDIETPREIVEVKLTLLGESKKILLKAQIAAARGKTLRVVYMGTGGDNVLSDLEKRLKSQNPSLQFIFEQIMYR
ncbi:MAG: HINT domain-containing protein [Bacteroidales bacterium]|nr:HINT domain-containing protein [Bacteroidales bacterium]